MNLLLLVGKLPKNILLSGKWWVNTFIIVFAGAGESRFCYIALPATTGSVSLHEYWSTDQDTTKMVRVGSFFSYTYIDERAT